MRLKKLSWNERYMQVLMDLNCYAEPGVILNNRENRMSHNAEVHKHKAGEVHGQETGLTNDRVILQRAKDYICVESGGKATGVLKFIEKRFK